MLERMTCGKMTNLTMHVKQLHGGIVTISNETICLRLAEITFKHAWLIDLLWADTSMTASLEN